VIRLLLLIPTLDRSGAEKQLTLLATHLPRNEFDVEVVALTRGGPYADELARQKVPLTVLNKRFRFDPAALWRLRRLLHRRQPDILHTWLFAANAYGRLAAGARPTFPIVVSERCVDSWKSGWQLWLDRKLVARTSRLVGNSQSVTDFYRRIGVPAEKLAVIPNGVETPTQAEPDRSALLAEFDIPSNGAVVGYVGRLARQKRIQDLIWAFELLRVQRENVYFLVVGDGPERGRLEAFAHKLQLHERIRFAGHRPDAARLLGCLDVFWLASEFEGMSNSLMEAMADGRPVVVSDIPPNGELVTDGETGLIAPVGDRAAFARLTTRLLTDAALAKRLGEAARRRIETEFSVSRMVESYTSLYRSLLS
jgi:glycosyltransferase involved in cell wall biosynthesis